MRRGCLAEIHSKSVPRIRATRRPHRRTNAPRRFRHRPRADARGRAGGHGRGGARGPQAPLPTLPSKYFYDARGSALFERITTLAGVLPDPRGGGHPRARAGRHRPARPRRASWSSSAPASAARPAACSTRWPRATGAALLHPARRGRGGAARVARRACAAYPGLRARGIVGDFLRDIPEVGPGGGGRRMIGFLGGTIGNLHPTRVPRSSGPRPRVLAPGDTFLLGVDLVKDAARLNAAYNDRAGVTAEFNRNLLRVINARLEADFDRRGLRARGFLRPARAVDRDAPAGHAGRPRSISRKQAWSAPLPPGTRSAPRSAASTPASASRGSWRDPGSPSRPGTPTRMPNSP